MIIPKASSMILDKLQVNKERLVVIFTKYDKAASVDSNEILSHLTMPNSVFVSAKTGYGLRRLKRLVTQHIYPTPLSKVAK
jgi:50S ribosomal subunit-associated GTPase HflX